MPKCFTCGVAFAGGVSPCRCGMDDNRPLPTRVAALEVLAKTSMPPALIATIRKEARAQERERIAVWFENLTAGHESAGRTIQADEIGPIAAIIRSLPDAG